MPQRPKHINVETRLERRITPSGKRRVSLTNDERKQLTVNQLCEAAAALFLDLETHRSWPDIAHELGISPQELKTLTKREEFQVAYNNLFADLGHDPRFQAAKGAIADMLPHAVVTLQDLVIHSRSDATKLKAAMEIIRLNGLNAPQVDQNDRQELAEFLKKQSIHLTQVNIAVPPEYLDAYRSIESPPENSLGNAPGSDVLEGAFQDLIPSPSEGTPSELEETSYSTAEQSSSETS